MSAQIDDVEEDLEKQAELDKQPEGGKQPDAKHEAKHEFNKQFAPPPELVNPKIKREEPTGEPKQPFIKKMIGEKQAAEQKASALEKEKADLEAKIADLTKKAEGTSNPAKEADYEARIKEAEGRLVQANKALDELPTLKKRLAAYDLQYDDDFQEKFVKPLEVGFREISTIIGNDKQRAGILQKAVESFGKSLSVQGEESNEARREAYELLDAVIDELPSMAKSNFSGTMEEIFGLMKRQKAALANPEGSREYLAEQRKQEMARQSDRLLKQWESDYNSVEVGGLPELEDFAEVAKKIGIEADTAEDERLARAAYTPQADRVQTVRILRQGAQFRKAVAVASVLSHKLKEANETIAALRGAGGGGGSSGGASGGEKKPTREEFNRKFAPPPGVH